MSLLRNSFLILRPMTRRERIWSAAPAKLRRIRSYRRLYARLAGQRAPPRRTRLGSKRALIIDLLRRGDGVALIELEAATDWLPHTTRAALTGLRKSGFVLEKAKSDDSTTLYRIVAEPAAASKPDADRAQLAA